MLTHSLCWRAAITRGQLKDRQSVMLGSWKNPELTAAVFDQFLGTSPVDPEAKLRAGCGLLFLTNGFKCGLLIAKLKN